jgi:hypothetical protein
MSSFTHGPPPKPEAKSDILAGLRLPSKSKILRLNLSWSLHPFPALSMYKKRVSRRKNKRVAELPAQAFVAGFA